MCMCVFLSFAFHSFACRVSVERFWYLDKCPLPLPSPVPLSVTLFLSFRAAHLCSTPQVAPGLNRYKCDIQIALNWVPVTVCEWVREYEWVYLWVYLWVWEFKSAWRALTQISILISNYPVANRWADFQLAALIALWAPSGARIAFRHAMDRQTDR